MSYNNRVQQPRGVPVYNKKTGKKVAVVSYEYGEERNPVTAGEGKKLRLFIDDKEVDITPPRKEELTLVAEKKQMMASMTQPVKPKSNRFACLDDSESDDDTDTIVTPKKSWATLTTPSAPEKKFPPPAKLVRQVGISKKLEFPPMNTRGAALNKTPTTGVWAKGLKTAVKEKHGSIGAWCAAPQETTKEFHKAQQTALKTELEKMRHERDILQAKLQDMIKAKETATYEESTTDEEPTTDEETHTSLKNIMDKYEGMSWADINEMDDNSAW
jgi:hypothetical protein